MRYWRLLNENREFAKLWVAQVISLTGDWFNTVVLSALVAQYTGGSGLAIGLFLMARFLPPLLVSPFAGVLVDRFNRQRLLVWSNWLRALIVPLFLLANTPDMLWLIYAVTIVQFTLSAIFEPGQSAIIPALTKPSMLVEANTLIGITWSVMLALGAVLGGIVAFLFGTGVALLVDAATFAVAGAVIAWIDYDPVRGRKLTKAIENSKPDVEDTSFREGLRYVRRTPQMAAALFVKLGGSIGNVDTLMTVFATQLFVIGANGEVSLGILYSVFGVGAFLGPIFANRVNDGSVRRMRRLIILGFVGIVLGWAFLGAASTLFIAAIAIFIRAASSSINWTYSVIIIQKTAPNAKLGRMFALDMAGFQLATVISTLVHGGLIDLLGVGAIHLLAIGTGLISLLPLAIWLWSVNYLEKHEAQTEIEAAAFVTGD